MHKCLSYCNGCLVGTNELQVPENPQLGTSLSANIKEPVNLDIYNK